VRLTVNPCTAWWWRATVASACFPRPAGDSAAQRQYRKHQELASSRALAALPLNQPPGGVGGSTDVPGQVIEVISGRSLVDATLPN